MTVALALLKRFWKPLAIIAALIALYLWHQSAVTSYGNERFQAGVTATLDKTRQTIAKINQDNQSREAALQARLDAYGDDQAEQDAERRKAEDRHVERLQTLLQTLPGEGCEIPQPIIDERNQIRALGPST